VGSLDSPAVALDAWALAHEAAAGAGVRLRPLLELEDADRILAVMGATWPGHEPFPREVLRALADSGNVPVGAFDGEVMLGYVLGWVGIDPEEDGPHVHSHMLAAVPDRRHRGIGYALKLAQRAQALDQRVGEARWTFDPLVARNGYFNLHKLGAVADRFDRNHYGAMVDSVNAGERSDRFTVRWDLERDPGPRDVRAKAFALAGRDDWPSEVRAPSERAALVAVPPDYVGMRSQDRERAAAWREASAAAVEACLTAGMIAAGFDRDASSYVFALAEDVPR
jgi:predicted GNAT superfamily acetyltransferase